MSGGEDFLYRPIRAGMCSMTDLKGGTLNLFDFVLANEALDVEDENKARIDSYFRTHGSD